MNTNNLLKPGKLKVIVRPNSKKDEILGWDNSKQALKIAISAPAEKNKANIALVKFFSKLTGKPVRILTGLKSKEKTLMIP